MKGNEKLQERMRHVFGKKEPDRWFQCSRIIAEADLSTIDQKCQFEFGVVRTTVNHLSVYLSGVNAPIMYHMIFRAILLQCDPSIISIVAYSRRIGGASFTPFLSPKKWDSTSAIIDNCVVTLHENVSLDDYNLYRRSFGYEHAEAIEIITALQKEDKTLWEKVRSTLKK